MPSVTDSSVQAAHELLALFSRLRRRIVDAARDDILTPSQIAVLMQLAKNGPSSACRLAQDEQIRPQSMTAILKALERRNLIERADDPDDGRRRIITLSRAGHRYADTRHRTHSDDWVAQAIEDLYTEQERRTLLAALVLLNRMTEP